MSKSYCFSTYFVEGLSEVRRAGSGDVATWKALTGSLMFFCLIFYFVFFLGLVIYDRIQRELDRYYKIKQEKRTPSQWARPLLASPSSDASGRRNIKGYWQMLVRGYTLTAK